MNFRLWLETSNKLDLNFDWITPDDIYRTPPTEGPYFPEEGFTFIYGKVPLNRRLQSESYPIEDRLYTSGRNFAHRDIRNSLSDGEREDYKPGWGWTHLTGVMGRCAEVSIDDWHRVWLITIWGKPTDSLIKPLLGPCIQAVRREVGPVYLPWVLSTTHGNKLIDNGKPRWQGSVTSPEDAEMLRQLHLMKSPDKLAARKKLGLFSMKKRPDAEYRMLQPENKNEF